MHAQRQVKICLAPFEFGGQFLKMTIYMNLSGPRNNFSCVIKSYIRCLLLRMREAHISAELFTVSVHGANLSHNYLSFDAGGNKRGVGVSVGSLCQD